MNIILFPEGVRSFAPDDERAVHIRKVLRLAPGDSFTAGEINGARGTATLARVGAEGVSFDFEPEREDSSLAPLTVIIAMVRPICMRRILRELVSMGVGRLVLTGSELGEKSYLSAGLYTTGEHEEIMLSGAMQGGHTGIPPVVFARSVREAVEAAGATDELLLLDNVIGAERFSDVELRGRSATIAIGGERGWTMKEREIFLSAGYRGVLMGRHILRTETACVAASALALHSMGLI